MAYNEDSARRVEAVLEDVPSLESKKMFGGIAYLVDGNMACGLSNDDLMVRVGPEKYSLAVMRPFVRPFDLTGRPMKGWVLVEPAGYESDDDLRAWIIDGLEFARSLPPK